MIQELRRQIPFEEFDYQSLMYSLRRYRQPRAKISALLADGAIVRVKKGLYVFGADYRRRPFSRELLANLIYGPSYISLDYALSYHGLIPEAVATVTSVTCGRSRIFSTPVGFFTYKTLPLEPFRTGMDRIETGDGRSFLMAIPEKALADRLALDRTLSITSRRELGAWLVEGLRIEPDRLKSLDADRLDEICDHYRSRKVALLRDLVRSLRKKEEKGHA